MVSDKGQFIDEQQDEAAALKAAEEKVMQRKQERVKQFQAELANLMERYQIDLEVTPPFITPQINIKPR